uniref:Uncharacterized protein n=1 Tax=Fagus sylvatica TaxID=28930 RepID=A0A2N9IX22_FAGSY
MDRNRFSRDTSRESNGGSITLQKKLAVEARRKAENVPDLTDFMKDMFFGTVNVDNNKVYNLTGGGGVMDEDQDFDSSTRSNSSKQTQEWLEEARRLVASSPSRSEPPSRLIGSPRFAVAQGKQPSLLDRRDPLSRSTRSQPRTKVAGKSVDSSQASRGAEDLQETRRVIGEGTGLGPAKGAPMPLSVLIPRKTLSVNFCIFQVLLIPEYGRRMAFYAFRSSMWPSGDRWILGRVEGTEQWRASVGKSSPNQQNAPATTQAPLTLPQQHHQQQLLQSHPLLRQSKNGSPTSLSPPIPHHHSLPLQTPPLPIQRPQLCHLASSPTASPASKPTPPLLAHKGSHSLLDATNHHYQTVLLRSNNKSSRFCLRRETSWSQRIGGRYLHPHVHWIRLLPCSMLLLRLEGSGNTKELLLMTSVLMGTSSIVAVICYAWLLENRMCKNKNRNKGEGDGDGYVVVPVINVRRRRMWKQRQAAWLLYHVGVDATSLLFADEVDLESLMKNGKLSIVVIGQDVLRTNSEVGSQCTILTDNYCEDAYDLLQTSVLKKLLIGSSGLQFSLNFNVFQLAGILLDTQNLKTSDKSSMTRDSEAVQLLLVGSAPNYRYSLFDQCDLDGVALVEHRVLEKK